MAAEFPELGFELGKRPNETMSALLLPVVRKAQEIGFFDTLVEGLGLRMKVYHYSHRNKAETIVAGIVVGCRHTSDIQTKLVPDTVAAALFGMARFPDQSEVNNFLRAFGPEQVAHLACAHQQLLLAHSRAGDRKNWLTLPDGQRVLPVDLDQTALTTRGTKAEGAARGHFGRKRSQFGYKKSLALLGARVKEVLWLSLEAGNVHGQEAVPAVLEQIAALAKSRHIEPHEILMRGDAQYGSTGTVRQAQAKGHHYLFKGYTPKTARYLAEHLPEAALWSYRGLDSYGSHTWVVDAGVQELSGHDDPPEMPRVRTRVVLLVRVAFRTRKKHGRGSPARVAEKNISFEHYLTDLSAEALPAEAVIDLYNDRETEESFFRSEQDAFGAQYLRTKHFEGEAAFLWLLASSINLLRWVQHTTFAGTPLEEAGLAKLVGQAMPIPATVIQEAQKWIVLVPETARLVRQVVSAWLQKALQLPLPLDGCYQYST
jgi:hypothetical protein